MRYDAFAPDCRHRMMIAAIREGFFALQKSGVQVIPNPLKMIFTLVPQFFAMKYWKGQLTGPVGTMAIAPHVRQSRTTEFPAIVAGVREQLRLALGRHAAPQMLLRIGYAVPAVPTPRRPVSEVMAA